MWQDELDPLEYGLLINSYIRRIRFESRVLISALSESMDKSKHDRISPDAMIAMLGGL